MEVRVVVKGRPATWRKHEVSDLKNGGLEEVLECRWRRERSEHAGFSCHQPSPSGSSRTTSADTASLPDQSNA